MRRLFKTANTTDSVAMPVDLLGPLKNMPPHLAQKGPTKDAEGSYHKISFKELEGDEETWDEEESQTSSETSIDLKESKDVKAPEDRKEEYRKELEYAKKTKIKNIRVAISTPQPGRKAESGLQLLVEYNVSSPFLMLPLSQNERDIRYYPAAEMDLFDFLGTSSQYKNKVEWKPTPRILSISQLKSFIGQIVLGIEALHAKGLAHRDIKLENILVTLRNGKHHIQICDFDTLVSIEKDSKIQFAGTPDYISPEVWKLCESNQINKDYLSEYKKCNHKASDCYALGIVLIELLSTTKDLKDWHIFCITKIRRKLYNKEKYCSIISDLKDLTLSIKVEFRLKNPDLLNEILQLLDLIEKLIDENPETRATIETVKEHPFFGLSKGKEIKDTTTVEKNEKIEKVEKPTFTKLKSEFGYREINGFRHTSCPEKGDNSAILPPPLSSLYLTVKDLENQIKYLLEWPLKLQTNDFFDEKDPHLQAREKFLECWVNFEASKERTFNKAEQILADIENLSELPLINATDVYKTKLNELHASLMDERKRDLFISITCPTRKNVYKDISAFLKAKERLYFKPKFEKGDSKSTSLSDIDYIKQWLEFREIDHDATRIFQKAKSALNSIQKAMELADEKNDTPYYKELKILKAEMTNQINNIKQNQQLLTDVVRKIKHCSKNLENPTAISKAIKTINIALATNKVAQNQNLSAELLLLKKRITTPAYQKSRLDQQESFRLAKKIQTIVLEAYDEYMGNLNKNPFSKSWKLTFFHWGNGKTARKFKDVMHGMFEVGKINFREDDYDEVKDLPRQLLTYINFHLENGNGGNDTYSFKTILANKLGVLKTQEPEINKIDNEMKALSAPAISIVKIP